jgi:RNA polymerase sigma factor (TIGR02999 family)
MVRNAVATMPTSADVTRLLIAYSDGSEEALEDLLPLVYEQLKRLAHGRLRDERPGHTLNTTGLVHEAYINLVGVNRMRYKNRGHFYAMASRVMRRILINYAQKRKAQKRGGGAYSVEFVDERLVPDDVAEWILDLEDLLQRFQKVHPRQAETVAVHYFGGLTNQETADALGVSLGTVERDLRFSRAWLSNEWNPTDN